MPPQILVMGDAQLQASGVKQGIEGAVDDPLGPDVHPAAGGHLAVVGHPHLLGDLPVLLVVEHAYHQGVGDDYPGGVRVGREQAERMS